MGVDPFPNAVLMLNEESLLCNYFIQPLLILIMVTISSLNILSTLRQDHVHSLRP